MSSSTWRRGGFAVATTGLALALAGCGGGDVEEISEGTPSEFGPAVAAAPGPGGGDHAPAPDAAPAPPAPAAPGGEVAAAPPAASPAATAPPAGAPPASPAPAVPGAPVPVAAGEAPAPAAPAEGVAPATGGEDNANTLALLQAANTAPAAPAAPDAANPAANANTPPGPGPGAAGPAAGMIRPPGGEDPGSMEESMRRGQGPGVPPGPGAAYPPGPGGPLGGSEGPGSFGGTGSAADVKTSFTSPEKAVESFLAVVKARNLEGLVTTISRRAPDEAHVKTQPIFRSILERTISADEIGDMATQLDGYKLMRRLPPQSTGRVEVMISKEKQDERKRHILYTRKVTTRREKSEWRILDISREAETVRPR